MIDTELHPRTGEFRSPDTELVFRTDQLRRDGTRLTTTGLLAAALLFGFTVVDLGSLGVGGEWAGLMVARAVAAVAVALLALGVRRDPAFFASGAGPRLVVAVEMLVLGVFLVVCAVRPDDAVTHSVSAVLMALVVAIFVPGTVRATSVLLGSFFGAYMVVAQLRFPEQVNLLALFANLTATAVFTYVVVTVLMDVDGFKSVNDRFGHAAGDALLRAIGAALGSAIRHDELVGRIGGEEFAVVATAPSGADGLALAERLRAAVRDAHAVVDGVTVAATVSVGFTEVAEHEELGAALARADRAMYGAKRAGGDRVLCDVG